MFSILNYCIGTLLAVFAVIIATLLYIHRSDLNMISDLNQKLAIANQSINTQNAAIDQWKLEGNLLKEKLRFTEHEASARARKSQERVNTIMKEKIPQDCEAAIRWGISHRQINI